MRNIVRQPVTWENFFKRPKLIKKIQKVTNAKLPLLLTGPKKSGKTSILYFLLGNLAGSYNFAYIDVGSIPTVNEYYETIYDALGALDFFKLFYTEMTEAPADVGQVTRLLGFYKENKPLLIMLDDFSVFLERVNKDDEAEIATRFLKYDQEFRSHCERSFSNIRFIYTSSIELETFANQLGVPQYISDLFPLRVPALSNEEAERFVQALAENADFDLGLEAIRYICQKMQWLIPFHLQLVFFELDSIYMDKELAEITNLVIDEAFERMLKHKDYAETVESYSQLISHNRELKKVRRELKKIAIQRIKIQHVKCFENVDISFDPSVNTSLIIGTNGKGKSTLLQLIALGLSGIRYVPFPQNWKEVVRKNSDKGFFEMDVLFDNNPIQFKFEIDNSDDSIICTEGNDKLKEIRDTFILLAYGVNRSIKLEEPKPYKDIEPVATLFGENGYLKHIKVSANFVHVDKHFNAIQALINKVLEAVNGGENVILESYDANGFYFKTPSNPEYFIPTEALSEGFKSTFVWLFDTIIRIVEKGGSLENASEVSGIILLDEIDLHLHPTWQRTILQSIETLFPNIQFIATTHSPFVVQNARKKCLIALEMEKDSNNVIVVDKNITSELSYDVIARQIFNIRFPFSLEIERKMNQFREMQYAIRDKKEIDEKKFVELVLDIASKGVELEGIMRRELRSLEYRTGKTFDLWNE